MCIICTEEIYKEDLNTLTELNVVNCSNLTSEKLQEILNQCKNLKKLWCYDCKSLTSLDLQSNINLKILWCSNCTFLINLNLPKKYKGCINHSNSCWIPQYTKFPNNLQKLIKLQRWYRRILLIKYMKSQEFVEWIYNPSNIGGRLYKVKLLKEFCI